MMSSAQLWNATAGALRASSVGYETDGRPMAGQPSYQTLLGRSPIGEIDSDHLVWAPTTLGRRWKWIGHAMIVGMAALFWQLTERPASRDAASKQPAYAGTTHRPDATGIVPVMLQRITDV